MFVAAAAGGGQGNIVRKRLWDEIRSPFPYDSHTRVYLIFALYFVCVSVFGAADTQVWELVPKG